MSRFEDNLWESVVERHGDELSHDEAAGRPSSRSRRPSLIAGASLGMAAAVTAVALLVTASANPTPAYALTRDHNGAVSVTVNRSSGVSAANRRLAALGIHRQVKSVTHGRSVQMGFALPASGCWMYETGRTPITVELSAAQQQSEIHNGIWTDPYGNDANNTGGAGTDNGPWHVIYCQSGSAHSAASRVSGTWGLPASGCWMNEPGKPPVTVELSAAQQQSEIHNGIWTDPYGNDANNTGGAGTNNGPWDVIYCTANGSPSYPS